MPIATNLDHRFSSLSMTDCLTKDEGVPANLVSPAKSVGGNSIFSTNSDDDASSEDDGINMLAQKTEHKLMEEQGMLKDEPLLQENPYRFVLFPIQDNEVSYHLGTPQNFIPAFMLTLCYSSSSGKCTRRQKPPSGRPKRSILAVT